MSVTYTSTGCSDVCYIYQYRVANVCLQVTDVKFVADGHSLVQTGEDKEVRYGVRFMDCPTNKIYGIKCTVNKY